MTPGRLPNWESGPQNQPSANVAVSNFFGASWSRSGIRECVAGVAWVEVMACSLVTATIGDGATLDGMGSAVQACSPRADARARTGVV
jgi:hypothetical protein